uniref:Uncharacterized protein n=1 Tax=Anopheles albimanus TaxID=7167 RepID=A0A182FXZ6_ANOAL
MVQVHGSNLTRITQPRMMDAKTRAVPSTPKTPQSDGQSKGKLTGIAGVVE